MSKVKILFLILILVIGSTSSGCIGKKTGETATPTQPAVTPGTIVSEKDLNAIENDLNNIDTIFNDSTSGDLIEVGVNESTFT